MDGAAQLDGNLHARARPVRQQHPRPRLLRGALEAAVRSSWDPSRNSSKTWWRDAKSIQKSKLENNWSGDLFRFSDFVFWYWTLVAQFQKCVQTHEKNVLTAFIILASLTANIIMESFKA